MKTLLISTVAALSLTTAAQAATQIIDPFTAGSEVRILAASQGGLSGFDSTSDTFADGSIFGGERDTDIERISGDRAVVADFAGSFTFENGANAVGNVDLTYDDGAFAAPGGTDLTMGNANPVFYLDVLASDLGFFYQIEVEDDFGNVGTASVGVNPQAPSLVPTRVEFKFSDFSGGVDFTALTRVTLMIDTGISSADLEIQEFGVDQAIPVRGAGILLATGLGILGLRSRRRS